MVHIPQMDLTIETGNADLAHSHRVFLGLEGAADFTLLNAPGNLPREFSSREFRCRRAGDSNANPFRTNASITLTFGENSNVANPELNDPRDPHMGATDVDRAYIRIDPNSSEPWKIKKATIEFKGPTSTPYKFELDATTSTAGFIMLDEDAAEKVYLPRIV
jgi:hypothetical protein